MRSRWDVVTRVGYTGVASREGLEAGAALVQGAAGVNGLRSDRRGILLITHYQRLLNHIKPDRVHIMSGGRIIASGGPELALHVEEHGYGTLVEGAA